MEFSQSSTPDFNPLKPFIPMVFKNMGVMENALMADHLPVEQKAIHCAPQILALGGILAQILSFDTPLERQTSTTTLTAILNHDCAGYNDMVKDDRWPDIAIRDSRGIVCSVLRKAVSACLDPRNFKGSVFSLEERRKWLFETVVTPLSYIADNSGLREERALFALGSSFSATSHSPHPAPHLLSFTPRFVASRTFSTTDRTDRRFSDSEDWLNNIAASTLVNDLRRYFSPSASTPKIPKRTKIAIIDTGYDPDSGFFSNQPSRQLGKRIRDFKDWVLDNGKPEDTHGHGTFVLSLLMRVAPCADIYVARVAENESDLCNAGPNISEVGAPCDPDEREFYDECQ